MRCSIALRRRMAAVLCLGALAGCGEAEKKPEAAPRKVAVTLATVTRETVEDVEATVGYIETSTAPQIAAEINGRVLEVLADVGKAVSAGDVLARVDPQDYVNEQRAARSEVARLQALLGNQQRLVERYRKLAGDNFVSATALDEAESNLSALTEQLATARARLSITNRAASQTVVRAPMSGVIEQRMVSSGDYVQRGQALFQIATQRALRVHLPFPETVMQRLRPGLTVYLQTPSAPDQTVTAKLTDLRPMVGVTTRSVNAIVDVENPGGWASGASVNARVVIETREAVVVPDLAVVLRPAGTVVYVLDEKDVATEQPVTVGERMGTRVEIRSGLNGGERIAVDGAHYLTGGVGVRIAESAS